MRGNKPIRFKMPARPPDRHRLLAESNPGQCNPGWKTQSGFGPSEFNAASPMARSQLGHKRLILVPVILGDAEGDYEDENEKEWSESVLTASLRTAG